ncbi:MAG: hypothetical protein KDK33_13540 [Leptospiraceae bacterium]|nr:hypothetical protein [Leptospiraceae bacterium]
MMPVRIIEETEDYAVFYKPAGLVFFEDSGKTDMLDQVRSLCADQASRLFPVHRLDRVTSGILLFAKGRKNANLLGNEFRFNRAEKVYVALSNRTGKLKSGFIQGDMERGRRGTWKLARTTNNPARTAFLSDSLHSMEKGLRLFWIKPITGKTHQIRVALKSAGYPILGDPMYNAFSEARQEDRTYLHALALRFSLKDHSFTIVDYPSEGSRFLNPLCMETLKDARDPFALPFPRTRPGPDQIKENREAKKKSSESARTGMAAKKAKKQNRRKRKPGGRIQ